MENNIEEEPNNIEKIPMTEENCESAHSPSEADDMMSHKIQPSLKEILYDFTQNTTLHGLRLILKDRVGIVRRVLWFLLFLTSTVLMGIQITNRVIYYYSYPITVDYNINFDQMLTFPTLTLCNQNTFKATPASQRHWYKLLAEIYFTTVELDEDTMQTYNASVLSIQDLYLATAHKKEDFIVACEWQNEICGPENFTEILTDQGVCYSFNDKRDAPLITSFAGPGNGLKLTLNVEQYEYMPGPNSAAGIKMLLHNHKEFPRVAEMGLAVATGAHAFVGAQLLKIKNLPKPHGNCGSGSSRFYDMYSPEACQLSCMTTYLDNLCGCRHMYMPHDEGYPAVCKLDYYLKCLRGAMVCHHAPRTSQPEVRVADRLYFTPAQQQTGISRGLDTGMEEPCEPRRALSSAEENVRQTCPCPAPCDYQVYDPVISYASSSMYATDKLLTGAYSVSLQRKYMQARETASRMDAKKFEQFKNLANEAGAAFRDLQISMNRNIQIGLQNQKTALSFINESMSYAWDTKKYLLQWQKYHVEMNFVSSKQELEDRMMLYLELGYQEFSYQVESRIKQLAQSSWNITVSPDVKTALYIEVLNMLNGRIDFVNKVQESYRVIYDAYSNGEPIFTYQFQEEPTENNDFLTPKPLLNYSLSRTGFSSNYSDSLEEDIEYLKDVLLAYVSLAGKSYRDNVASRAEIEELNAQFLNWAPRFRQSKSIFFTETVDYPLKIMTKKLDDFDSHWREFEADFKLIEDKIDLLMVNLSRLQNTVMAVLEQNIAKTQMYISTNNVTKMQVAELFTSEQTLKGIEELENFFRDVRSHGLDIYKGWSALTQSSNAIWAMILDDENMENYYKYNNMTDFLSTFSHVSAQVVRNNTRYRDMNNVQLMLGQRDSSFIRSLDKLVADLKEFISGSVLDTDFINNNFLRLDVFYNEKGFEQITQQAGYDAFALLCDIGGTMALFLGASVLTLCELLDLGLHHAIYRLTHNDSIQ